MRCQADLSPVWVIVTAVICLGIAIWWVFATFCPDGRVKPLPLA
jgi:hypothetical protein